LFEQKPYGYKLEFHFAENPYFANKVLTKTYELTNDIDPKDPFSFEGPDLHRSLGCKIDWKPAKNVTVKLIKKKLKPKNKKGVPKIITKEEKQDSFFNFFTTIEKKPATNKSPASSGAEDKAVVAVKGRHHADEEDEEEEDETELYRIADFEIGQYLREKIIPKAILYYTGEYDGLEDDYDEYDDEDEDEDGDEDDDDEEDEDEDDDDDDDDDDEDDGKKPGKGKKPLAIQGKGAKNKLPGAKGGEPTPSECKQN
jgi:nucleosome assembly protein 1-like 1